VGEGVSGAMVRCQERCSTRWRESREEIGKRCLPGNCLGLGALGPKLGPQLNVVDVNR
jgi:hypothetical protein